MDKIQLLLAAWGLFCALCGVGAKLAPAGKLQALLAHIGSLATPKQVEAPKESK